MSFNIFLKCPLEMFRLMLCVLPFGEFSIVNNQKIIVATYNISNNNMLEISNLNEHLKGERNYLGIVCRQVRTGPIGA